jgi:hypothetical protein
MKKLGIKIIPYLKWFLSYLKEIEKKEYLKISAGYMNSLTTLPVCTS